MSDAVDQFAAFLHDGHVRSVDSIEDVVEADLLQSGNQFARCLLHAVHADLLTPCDAYCRCELDHGDGLRICQCVEDFVRIVSFAECADRAVGDALTAKAAVGVPDRHAVSHADCSPEGGTEFLPYVHVLDLVADLYAAQAGHALGGIPDEWEGVVPAVVVGVLHIGGADHAQVSGDALQRAVAASRAGCAFAVVLCQHQLDVDLSRLSDTRAVGVDDHAFFDFCIT